MDKWLTSFGLTPAWAVVSLFPLLASASVAPPRRAPNWLESVALTLQLAHNKVEWVDDEERRFKAYQELLRLGMDPCMCLGASNIPLNEQGVGGLTVYDHCTVYNHPGQVQQTRIEWDRPRLYTAGSVIATGLAGLAVLLWVRRARRAILAVEYWRQPPPK